MNITEILNSFLRDLDKTDEFPFRMQTASERVYEDILPKNLLLRSNKTNNYYGELVR